MISTLICSIDQFQYSVLFSSMNKCQAINISIQAMFLYFCPAFWILIHAYLLTFCSLCTETHPAALWDPWPANNYKYLFASACLKITVLQWSVLDEVQESCAASSSQHSESGLRVQREIGQCQEADILIASWSTGKKSHLAGDPLGPRMYFCNTPTETRAVRSYMWWFSSDIHKHYSCPFHNVKVLNFR